MTIFIQWIVTFENFGRHFLQVVVKPIIIVAFVVLYWVCWPPHCGKQSLKQHCFWAMESLYKMKQHKMLGHLYFFMCCVLDTKTGNSNRVPSIDLVQLCHHMDFRYMNISYAWPLPGFLRFMIQCLLIFHTNTSCDRWSSCSTYW